MDNVIYIDYTEKLDLIYTGLEQIYSVQTLALVIALVIVVLYLIYRAINVFLR